jgi:hypothetical protein
MYINNWIESQVTNGKEATISLALLEKYISKEVPSLKAIEKWANLICKKTGCKASIFYKSDVVTFYPITKL